MGKKLFAQNLFRVFSRLDVGLIAMVLKTSAPRLRP